VLRYLYCYITSHDIPEETEDTLFEMRVGSYTWGQCLRCNHWIRIWREPDCKEDEYYEQEVL
jgi:hypothetical protein